MLEVQFIQVHALSMSRYRGPDFPGATVDRSLPANAGGHGFDPWFGKIPQAEEQLSQWTTTTEPTCFNY